MIDGAKTERAFQQISRASRWDRHPIDRVLSLDSFLGTPGKDSREVAKRRDLELETPGLIPFKLLCRLNFKFLGRWIGFQGWGGENCEWVSGQQV